MDDDRKGAARWRAAFVTWKEEEGVSLTQLAGDLGVSVATVCRWESGSRIPSKENRDIIQQRSKGAVRALLIPLRQHQIKWGTR